MSDLVPDDLVCTRAVEVIPGQKDRAPDQGIRGADPDGEVQQVGQLPSVRFMSQMLVNLLDVIHRGNLDTVHSIICFEPGAIRTVKL